MLFNLIIFMVDFTKEFLHFFVVIFDRPSMYGLIGGRNILDLIASNANGPVVTVDVDVDGRRLN